jgi:apolipoprotein N-acyltransferase
MRSVIKTLNPSFISYFLSFFSGAMMGITVAPFSVWFFAWIAIAPLWVLIVDNSKKVKGKNSFYLLPFFWGIGYHGTALSWITGLHPLTWMGVPWLGSIGIALFAWIFVTLWGAILVTVWGFFMSKIPILAPGILRVIIGTSLWCCLEGLWSCGPLWWSSISYTQSPYNLAILHLGQLSGPSTITAAIVAVNGLLAEGFLNRQDAKGAKKITKASKQFNYFTIATVLLISLHLIGFNLYSSPLTQPANTALKIGLIQGNVPTRIKLFREGIQSALLGYTNGYLALADQGVDAVLTPEGALPFWQYDILKSSVVKAIKEKGIPAWIGGFYSDDNGSDYRITNSLFGFNGKGEIISRYGKVKMVPLGEYIPFQEILGGIIGRLSPQRGSQSPGNPNQLIDTTFGRAIVGICYESAFSDIFRRQAAAGGQFILTASNNDPYNAAMQFQHHAQDTMRAIETDRWAVRATNTGLSAFVNPHGKTLWISGHKTYEVHGETIYKRNTQTLYVFWGDWLTPFLLVISCFCLVYLFFNFLKLDS